MPSSSTTLPKLPNLKTVIVRLPAIFPEGVEHRGYCIREIAAKTIWTMLYARAIEGADRWIRPSMVVNMSDEQASLQTDADRDAWYGGKKLPNAKKWYAENTREPIRDETLQKGLIPTGAVIYRDVPTTSMVGRYALAGDFAALFDESLDKTGFEKAALEWQKAHLSKAALARIAIVRGGTGLTAGSVLIKYPNGHTRSLASGPSATLSKAVIEEFAPRYLAKPAVLWLSESASKVQDADDALAKSLGIKIDPAKQLPDLILVDLDAPGGVLIIFVEVVATDGPVDSARKAALLKIAMNAGFEPENLAFVTAFADRSASAYKKCVGELAWDSFAWFASEPDALLILRNGKPKPIHQLRSA